MQHDGKTDTKTIDPDQQTGEKEQQEETDKNEPTDKTFDTTAVNKDSETNTQINNEV